MEARYTVFARMDAAATLFSGPEGCGVYSRVATFNGAATIKLLFLLD